MVLENCTPVPAGTSPQAEGGHRDLAVPWAIEVHEEHGLPLPDLQLAVGDGDRLGAPEPSPATHMY